MNENGEIISYDKSVKEKNIFLRVCYNHLKQGLVGSKCIKMPQFGFSFSEKIPEYKSQDEWDYYKRALIMIINENEEQLEILYKEQTLKNKLLFEKLTINNY